MTDEPTGSIVLSKDEETFVRYLLKTAAEDETSMEKAQAVIKRVEGENVIMTGGAEGFYTNPPTPDELLEKLQGRRLELQRVELDALQVLLTYYVYAMELEGEPPLDLHSLYESLSEKMKEAYVEVGAAEEEELK